jgi:multimeric flavodoxin WrbA
MLKILGISGSRVKNGNTYKLPLRNKIGGAMALAFFRGGGIETTLASLNLFFHVQHMIVANSGMYQLGAGAFTSRDGKGRFEKAGILSWRMKSE